MGEAGFYMLKIGYEYRQLKIIQKKNYQDHNETEYDFKLMYN